MKNWLISKGLAWVGNRLKGYKTYAAGVGFIMLGVTGFLAQTFPDAGLPGMDADRAMESIMAGLACFGVGHKIERLVQPSTTPQPAPASTGPTAAIQSGVIEQEMEPGPSGSGFNPNGI